MVNSEARVRVGRRAERRPAKTINILFFDFFMFTFVKNQIKYIR